MQGRFGAHSCYEIMIANCRSQASRSRPPSLPSFLTIMSFGIVVSLHRTRQSTVRPAIVRSWTLTSLGQLVCFDEVIIATSVELFASLNAEPDRITTGLRLRTGISANGKGMTAVSYLSQITERFLVFRAGPFREKRRGRSKVVVSYCDLTDFDAFALPIFEPVAPD